MECTEPKDKAATFNHCFHFAFSSESSASPKSSQDSDSTVFNPYLTPDQVSSVKKNLDINKSVGPGGFYKLAPFLCHALQSNYVF